MLTTLFILLFSVPVLAPCDRVIYVAEYPAVNPYEALWSATCFVESSNNPFAVGDKHLKEQSYGIAMIRQSRLDDYFRQTGIRYTVTEMFDTVKARRVFMFYAVGTDMEVISRCWNGGNRGMEKESTKEYWKKIKAKLMETQLSLFRNTASLIDINEAPEGFIAVSKDEATTPNVCNSCDAKKLCQENADDWCFKNRCMSYEIIAFRDGKIYQRKDGQSVMFKRFRREFKEADSVFNAKL